MKLLTLFFFMQMLAFGKRPNIVFIFSDDHALQAIGAYQGIYQKLNPTPEIDRLASEGVIFDRSFCTNSICGPSRAVILTGKHSHLNGFMNNGNQFDGDQQTFPKLLQKAGYQTALFGKWHLKSTPQGFHSWKVLPGQGEYYNPVLLTPDGQEIIQGHCTDVVTDLAVEWLREHVESSEEPFLLMCQHKAPHRNWMPALRHLSLYDDLTLPEPESLFDQHEGKASPARHQELEINRHMDLNYDLFYQLTPDSQFEVPNGMMIDRSAWHNMKRMTPTQLSIFRAHYDRGDAELKKASLQGPDLVRWKYQRYAKNFLRCVKGVDESVGTLMAELKRLKLDDNTIVIYSSDQGFYVGDRGWYDKRWMYEESLQMPLIIKWPGVTTPGSRNQHLVQNLDYAPTLLEAAGVERPADLQGRSLVPLLRGESPAWRDAIYYHYYEYPSVHMVPRHRGVRTQTHKLIHFYNFDEWEFYDLINDPGEQKNLYFDPNHAEKIAELKNQLEKSAKEYRDETLTPKYPEERIKKLRERNFSVSNKL